MIGKFPGSDICRIPEINGKPLIKSNDRIKVKITSAIDIISLRDSFD